MRKQTINEAMELKAEKRKKNKKRIKKLVFWVKFIFITAMFLSAVIFTCLSPLFDLKEIEVNGAGHYKNEILEGYANIQMGENGFREIGSSPLNVLLFRFGSAEASIKQNCPYIKDVRVKYAIPSKVVINVTERTAAASVPYLGTSLVIDMEGYVLEAVAADKKQVLPMIKGLEFTDYVLGSQLDIKNRESLNGCMELMEALKENDETDKNNIFALVDTLDASDGLNIKMTLDARVVVNFGDLQDLNYKISTTKTIYNKNIKKSEKGILDFTTGANPIFSPDSGGK